MQSRSKDEMGAAIMANHAHYGNATCDDETALDERTINGGGKGQIIPPPSITWLSSEIFPEEATLLHLNITHIATKRCAAGHFP
jgi:hypothetical protein